MFTQGKWEIDDYGDRWIIVPEDRTRVILAIGQVAPSDKANAERICLCVNALDGLSNEQIQLIADTSHNGHETQISKQRKLIDELRDTLKKLLDSEIYADAECMLQIRTGGLDDNEHREIVAKAEAVLAKTNPQ